MDRNRTFKFLDSDLNRQLHRLLHRKEIDHFIDKEGIVYYSSNDREVFDNDLVSPIRDKVFPAWQTLTCPTDWIPRYKEYMGRHGVPFQEELSNGVLWFLIPRKYRPHSWKLEFPSRMKSKQENSRNGRKLNRPLAHK
jgi:hypothetical protein